MRNSKTKRIRICAYYRRIAPSCGNGQSIGSLLHWNQVQQLSFARATQLLTAAVVVIVDQDFVDTFSPRADWRLFQKVLSLAAEVRYKQVGGEDSFRASPIGWWDLRREP